MKPKPKEVSMREEQQEGEAQTRHGDDTPADRPGPSDPSPDSVPSEEDAKKDLPGVPEEQEEDD